MSIFQRAIQTMSDFLTFNKRIQERRTRLEGGLVATEIALLEEMTGKRVSNPETYLRLKAREFQRNSPREIDLFIAGGMENLDDLSLP